MGMRKIETPLLGSERGRKEKQSGHLKSEPVLGRQYDIEAWHAASEPTSPRFRPQGHNALAL